MRGSSGAAQILLRRQSRASVGLAGLPYPVDEILGKSGFSCARRLQASQIDGPDACAPGRGFRSPRVPVLLESRGDRIL